MPVRFILSAALIAVIGAGCAAAQTRSRPILNDGYNAVRLETRLDPSGNPIHPGFEHPAEIGEADLSRLLLSIRIVEPPGFLSALLLKAKPTAEPALTPKEAEFLSAPLSAALRKASPEERVVFFLHHQRSIYKGTTTSGVAFIRGNRLHIILGRYRMGNQPGRPDIVIGGKPLPEMNDQNFSIAQGRFQIVEDRTVAPGGKESVFDKRWVSIDYAALLKTPAEADAPASEDPSREPVPFVAPTPAPPLTLEEKLKTLRKLKEDGLITEDEYQEKRKALLQSF